MRLRAATLDVLPVLPLKDTVLFPHVAVPISVGRPASIAAVEAALASEDRKILTVLQRSSEIEVPGADDIHSMGTIAMIKRMSRPDASVLQLLVLGSERARIKAIASADTFMRARVEPMPMSSTSSPEVEAFRRSVVAIAERMTDLMEAPRKADLGAIVSQAALDPARSVYLLTSSLALGTSREQAILEAKNAEDAFVLLHGYLVHEVQVLELKAKLAEEVKEELTREQREHLLRSELRVIQKELGEQDPEQSDLRSLRQRIEDARLPEQVLKEASRELARLERLPPIAAEHAVIRAYLELVIELPWNEVTEERIDINCAREVLDRDHYDLEDVKRRILQHLGVLKLNPGARSPILCFVGPPGVGKTSLGQSIARALGRAFDRMSLGGMHDEAELRGHRRTYVGAMPGRIIQAIRRSHIKNPVIMLDEVDKVGQDTFRGDPASALLEILDPAQNYTFRDNYLELAFDLSRVLFLTTANTLDNIPRPLLDRFEILRLPGYTAEEKLHIARRYLIPRQVAEVGLDELACGIPDLVVRDIVDRYTREAGVRQLERMLGAIARSVALRFAEGKIEPVRVRSEDLADMLGSPRFVLERARRALSPGVAAGLAWTEAGGEVLYVEAAVLPDVEGLTLTGQLGSVMQESARAAHSYLWSRADALGIDRARYRHSGLHIHVPQGATPKDGPSAGVPMAVAVASLYRGTSPRSDTAMMGEITLSGLVLPVGGVKEKVLAAHRAGIHRIILPKENVADLREIPEAVRNETEFIFAERIEDALAAALS